MAISLASVQSWLLRTSYATFVLKLVTVVVALFLLEAVTTTTIKIDGINEQITRSQVTCDKIKRECDQRAAQEKLTAEYVGGYYNSMTGLACRLSLESKANVLCGRSDPYTWPEMFFEESLNDKRPTLLLLTLTVLLLPFLAAKQLVTETNLGWKRLTITFGSLISLCALYAYWDERWSEDFFMLWYGTALLGFIAPLFVKRMFFWIRNGFAVSSNKAPGSSGNQAPMAQNLSNKAMAQSTSLDTQVLLGSTPTDPTRKLTKANYWPRFFARCIDLPLAYLVASILGAFVPELPVKGEDFALASIVNLLVWLVLQCVVIVLWEAAWLSKFGATPGKMLLGLTVQDKDGDRPSWQTALTRTRSFLSQGLFYMLFFPYLQTFTAWTAWKRSDQMQPWDFIGTQVLQKPVNAFWVLCVKVLAILLLLGTVVMMQVVKNVYKQEIRNQTRQVLR